MIQVDIEKCTGCGDCLEVCTNQAVSLYAGKAAIDLDNCLACGACLQACPVGAISEVELPIPVEAVSLQPLVVQESSPLEVSPVRRLAPWAGAVLAFMGREIVPRLADSLIAALDRRLSQEVNLATATPRSLASQDRCGSHKPRRARRRVGQRRLS